MTDHVRNWARRRTHRGGLPRFSIPDGTPVETLRNMRRVINELWEEPTVGTLGDESTIDISEDEGDVFF